MQEGARAAHSQLLQSGSTGDVITDRSGTELPKCVVMLEYLDCNQKNSVNTNRDRHRQFAQLLIGNYGVAVEITGFNKSASDGLAVASQGELHNDIHLQVGIAIQSVKSPPLGLA